MNGKTVALRPTGGLSLPAVRIASWRRSALLALPLALPVLLLGCWQAVTSFGWMPVQVLPPPMLVVATFVDLVRSGDILNGLRISLWRLSLGLGFGVTFGLLFGALLGASRGAEGYFGPTFRALAQVPSLGWLPILMLIFGLDESLKVILIAKASFVPTALATCDAIRQVPQSYREAARIMQLRRGTWLLKVFIPATIPTVFTGLRLSISAAWIALVVVEMLAATEGVGYMMVWGRTLFQIDIVIVGMVIIGVIGFAMDRGLTGIERRLGRWKAAHD